MQKLAESDKKQQKYEMNDFATFWREKNAKSCLRGSNFRYGP